MPAKSIVKTALLGVSIAGCAVGSAGATIIDVTWTGTVSGSLVYPQYVGEPFGGTANAGRSRIVSS